MASKPPRMNVGRLDKSADLDLEIDGLLGELDNGGARESPRRALHPKPEILSPTPETRNSKPETLGNGWAGESQRRPPRPSTSE